MKNIEIVDKIISSKKYTLNKYSIWGIYSAPTKRSVMSAGYKPPVFLCAAEGTYEDVVENAVDDVKGFVNGDNYGEIRELAIKKIDKSSKITKLNKEKNDLLDKISEIDSKIADLAGD